MHNIGFLLINIGTPRSPTTRDVRRYLNEFLMDPFVIATPWWVRRLLVSLFILPFRPRRSASAYAKIWTDAGSPFLLHSQTLARNLAASINAPVALGMRYGSPSIETAIEQLLGDNVEEVIVVPLYPQFADSTVTTSIIETQRVLKETPHRIVPPFYNQTSFIDAYAQTIRRSLPEIYDHVLFSYHGLPEQHIKNADPTGTHCLAQADCCTRTSQAHASCYRHQVHMTSSALAHRLGLKQDNYTTSYQSRLGRLPWLTPDTKNVLQALPQQGVKDLVVACPSFVTDNLETLEEIDMQGRDIFLRAGGESFHLMPCPNTSEIWVNALTDILQGYTTSASARTSS
ncbi:MAG: ferrochelatase [Pseudomonadota bacterium]|nr:ferrochelatase [Pseudomonadota bacterium]